MSTSRSRSAAGCPTSLSSGLPDKAVKESRERVQATLQRDRPRAAAAPHHRNLSPADLPKEGSHYDLPIALGLLGAMGMRR